MEHRGSLVKLLRYVAFALGGGAALVVAAALFVIATFDAERIKSEIGRIVKEHTQRTLEIEGDIQLSFWPALGVRFGKASLSQHANDKAFAALERAQFSLALLPLLRKQVVFDKLAFDGVTATIVRRADGSLDIDDLLSTRSQDSEMLRFEVASVQLTDSRLELRDEQGGRRVSVSGLDLSSGRVGAAADGKLALEGRFEIDEPAVAVDVAVAGDYRYDLGRGHYEVFGLDANVKGKAGAVDALDLRLAAAALRFERHSGGVEIERLDLGVEGRHGEGRFEADADVPMLVMTPERALGHTATLALELGTAQRGVAATINLAGIEGSTQALKFGNVKAEIDARQGQTTIKGSLDASLVADFAARALDLPQFAGVFTVADPHMPVKRVELPARGSLHADLIQRAASGSLSAQFDETSVRARWSVPRLAPLALGFDVAVDSIDLDKYLPRRPERDERMFDLSALDQLDASGTLRIGDLKMSEIRASNVRLDIRANNGRLEVNPLAAELYGGTLAGSFALDAKSKRIALAQTLSGVAIDAMLKDFADYDMIDGRGNVALDLASAGATVAALKRGVNGTARITLKDGAIKGIDLAKSLRDGRGALPQPASNGEKTVFAELAASFRIADGIARSGDLAIRSPLLRLRGSGSIDLAEGSIDYVATARVDSASAGRAAKERAGRHGASVPVKVSGSWRKPSYELHAAARLGGVAETAAEPKLRERAARAGREVAQRVESSVSR